MNRCLFVRPAPSRELAAGDEVVYRRLIGYIPRRLELEILELEPAGRREQLLEMLRGAPPEAATHAGPRNAERLRRRLAGGRFTVVCFGHERLFHLHRTAASPGVRRVLVSHNTHSMIARTDPSPLARLAAPLAERFERRYYNDPAVELVCLSRSDIQGLRRAGVQRDRFWLCPPGAPPSEPLQPGARPAQVLVLTGSYAWWRKRRDLAFFAGGPALEFPILVTDRDAKFAFGDQARLVAAHEIDWASRLRFGVITDRFLGGFKLKSLEYVARNCIILSFCDLSAEFAGLPHANLFVRFVKDKAEVSQVIGEIMARPADELRSQFEAFKAACLAKFSWDACLASFRAALDGEEARPAVI